MLISFGVFETHLCDPFFLVFFWFRPRNPPGLIKAVKSLSLVPMMYVRQCPAAAAVYGLALMMMMMHARQCPADDDACIDDGKLATLLSYSLVPPGCPICRHEVKAVARGARL